MYFIVKKPVDYFTETCAFFLSRTRENGLNIHSSKRVGFWMPISNFAVV